MAESPGIGTVWKNDHQSTDVVVVGAGFGGVYAMHKFRSDNLDVVGLEAASGVGGVWYHNRYPGARVDVDSLEYCYHFSEEIYREWRWTERYAAQPELLAYINHVADRLDIKRHFHFDTWMTSAQWRPDEAVWEISTSTGVALRARFLVMATGNLSAARDPDFPGLQDFKGEWVQASHWPERDVRWQGRRVGVIGTGSSGVQAITAIARQAERLTVFQRSPNFSVPARNGPLDEGRHAEVGADVGATRAALLTTGGGIRVPPRNGPALGYSEAEREAILEAQWERGGQTILWTFEDQGIDQAANDVVANFARNRIRAVLDNPATADKLIPTDHPFGSRRLCIDTGYYEVFNQPNVELVDVREDPIIGFTETGIQTRDGHYELDVVVFALGFHAFTGALKNANIRNEHGHSPIDGWTRGPRTFLGLMTADFPNLFVVTGPGSPSVLSNMVLLNEFHIDWIAGCIGFMNRHGYRTVQPTVEAQDAWTSHVADVAKSLLRLGVKNYMVHVNEDDGSRVFMPYAGGLDAYVRASNAVADGGYRELSFT